MKKEKKENVVSGGLDRFYKCKFCGKSFRPSREWRRFCTREHQKEYWKQVQNDKRFLIKRMESLEKRIENL